ncbi:hypothetical protein SDC9_121933 [bioreactor metagenome]|uniref:Uncharacterized protein n=1 Tax=bioreactor metagenome TaxID=1076179 RepID=A0A645CDD4_9ZZZZ
MGVIASFDRAYHADMLVLTADRNTAAAKYAFGIISDEMNRAVFDVWLFCVGMEFVHVDAVVTAESLKLAVGVSCAGKTVGSVV